MPFFASFAFNAFDIFVVLVQELSTFLPPFEGRNEGGNSQLIFLRDSVGRLWPVLCTVILDVTALVDGWQQFCQKNDIRLGDLCKLKCENSDQFIYGVDVDVSANQLAKLNFQKLEQWSFAYFLNRIQSICLDNFIFIFFQVKKLLSKSRVQS